jgi:TnpA family transposase
MIKPEVPALSRSRLGWVKQNYVRADTLTAANAKLVAAQNDIDLVRAWGAGDVASADGLRFVVPIRTIHSGPNPRYFGRERGVTYYNMTSDQYTGLNGVVVPGTLRDSLVLLSVVLEQETELKPVEIMTDTGAYTDAIFGIRCRRRAPVADRSKGRLWRVQSTGDRPHQHEADYRAMGRPAAARRLPETRCRAGLRADADAPNQQHTDTIGAGACRTRTHHQNHSPAEFL